MKQEVVFVFHRELKPSQLDLSDVGWKAIYICTDSKKFSNNFVIVLIRLDFYETIKRLRLGTFVSMKKTVKVKTNSIVVQFSAQRVISIADL